MKLNKVLLLTVIPISIVSSTITNTYRNINHIRISSLTNEDNRKSLTLTINLIILFTLVKKLIYNIQIFLKL